VKQYRLSEYDADVLTGTHELAAYYEAVASKSPDPKLTANWVMVELLGALNAAGLEITASPVAADNLAGMVALIADGTISGKMAKTVFEQMFATSKTAQQIVDELGLKQITDDSQILDVVKKIVAANPKQLEQYRAGKTALFGFFVGQVMKETKGQANPSKVNELLKAELDKG
jgi:aspartyl-tRNA(Asn)/glutamyl-tRNA(Gln) amidotransferase subunit B